MCGIAGYSGTNASVNLQAMIATLSHRGPDDTGIYEDAEIGLANARLKIVDLQGGHQPLCGEDSRVWVTFNGEIFNYKSERRALEKARHRFSTNADTEVLVHLYEELGIDMVNRLNGMFAFGLWDSLKGQLLLARDYAGMKPLYYTFLADETLAFASEIKALLTCQDHVEPNVESFADFLALGYLPSNDTMFRGIEKLRPGQLLIATKAGRKFVRYHKFSPRLDSLSSENELTARLASELDRSVGDWLMSDVPLGAYISGGIDSAVIATLTAAKMESKLRTYTAWFGPEYPNELQEAEVVSNHLSTEHTQVLVSEDEVVRVLDTLAWAYDEPVADAALVPTYFVSRAARRDVKVVIAGEGGDELFAGYPWHRLFEYLGALDSWYPSYSGWRAPYLRGHLTSKAASLVLPGRQLAQRYLEFIAIFSAHEVRGLVRAFEKGSALQIFSGLLDSPEGSTLSRMLVCDSVTRLAESYLMKADKGSMANSVEERAPYLDKHLMELAFSIPDHLKISLGTNKVILRNVAGQLIPKSSRVRRKRGYGVPVREWILGEIGDYLVNLIETSDLINSTLKPEGVSNVTVKRAKRPHQFWLLGSLALWDHSVLSRAAGGRGPMHELSRPLQVTRML